MGGDQLDLKMSKHYILATVLVALFLLSGCVITPLTVIGSTPLLVRGPKTFDLPNYSLGPVSSDQFSDLLEKAIPPNEGVVHLFGPANLSLSKDNRYYSLSAVAALSDSAILLLKWYEPEKQYKLLARLPYSEILSVSTNSWGLGRVIYLCLATTEFALGDHTHAIDQRADMTFDKPSRIFQDVEKAKAAFSLLQEKIKPIDGACDARVEETDESR